MLLSFEKIEIAAARGSKSLKEVLAAGKISQLTAKRIKEKRPVRTQTAGKLAQALNCDVAELVQDGQ